MHYTIAVTEVKGESRRVYNFVHIDPPPDRKEAVDFFENHGILHSGYKITPEIQSMPIDQANDFLRQHPTIEQWTSLMIKGDAKINDSDLFRLQFLPEIQSVHILSSGITDVGVQHLLHLRGLRSLGLHSKNITEKSLDIISRLPAIRGINLQGCPNISREKFNAMIASFPNRPEAVPPFLPSDRPPRNPHYVRGKLPSPSKPIPAGLRIVRLWRKEFSPLPADLFDKDDIWLLEWSKNELEEMPEALGNLTRLETLHATSCNLHRLPDSIGKLNNLEYLRLSGNHFESLPDSFANLANLKHLWLDCNRFESLPDSFANLTSLLELELHSNRLNQFPRALLQLTQLESLGLTTNGILEIPEEIGQMTQLRRLSISANNIRSLPASIAKLPHLESLSIAHNPITEISLAILQMPSLFKLDMRGVPIRDLPKEANDIPILLY